MTKQNLSTKFDIASGILALPALSLLFASAVATAPLSAPLAVAGAGMVAAAAYLGFKANKSSSPYSERLKLSNTFAIASAVLILPAVGVLVASLVAESVTMTLGAAMIGIASAFYDGNAKRLAGRTGDKACR